MKNIKSAFDSLSSKVSNQPKGCVQCKNDDCGKCKKHKNLNADETSIPPTPGCCDLKVQPFFGAFIEPITSTEFITESFTILTTNGVSECQVTLEFYSQCFDGSSDTYLNINGIDNLLPNNFPTQYTFNDGDVIFLKTLHRFANCSSAFTLMNNVSCLIDYGAVYSINFGDPACDFCPQWNLIPISIASTSIFTSANYPIVPPPPLPGFSYLNSTSQAIDLFLNPTIQYGNGELYLLSNGVQVHTLYDGNELLPIVYTMGVGEIIGFQQNSQTSFFRTETFINNETCDIFIGSQIMENY